MGSWSSKVWDPDTRIPDLHSKVAVVTGANAGIGYAITIQLARHGAKVYLASRSESKALGAIEQLHKDYPEIEKGKLIWLPLDLSLLKGTVQAAQTILDNEERLDILVNNAGMAAHSFQTTPDGFELAMGVNHLGHFLFTVKLLPLLKSTAAMESSDVRVVTVSSDVRVVTVSSSAHRALIPAKMRFDKMDDFEFPGVFFDSNYTGMRDLFARYALSKLANVLFAKELQRRLDAEKIAIVSTTVNPGPTYTEGGMSVWPAWLRPILSRLFVPVAKGALPIIYLACEPDVGRHPAQYKARYYNVSCKAEDPSVLSQDAQVAMNLWETSEKALAEYIKA